MSENRPILPELIAAKLDKARNFENPAVLAAMDAEPRLVEMLWFIQWVSLPQNYPGGLAKFASDLVTQSIDFLPTPTMKANAGKPYTEAVRNAILEELPRPLRWDHKIDERRPTTPWGLSEAEKKEWMRKQEERELKDEAERKAHHLSMEEAQILRRLSEGALDGLTRYLERLCEDPDERLRAVARGGLNDAVYHYGEPTCYFSRVTDAILRFMDCWKVRELAKIAETEITRHCFLWIEKAAKLPGRGIMIEGNSRFGKTDAIRAWCQAFPGRARFVRTPPAGGESELLRAVAFALGIDRDRKYRAIKLRTEIEFVLRNSGLMLIFDEAHYIFPTCFGKNTAPARLNWIRHAAMDAGCPVVFIFTPQSYRSAKSKFVKATGFAIEHFEGRILKTTLPPTVPREDLLSIARIHFQGVAENCLEYVVSIAAATERNYVSDISNIAVLAFHNAEQAGRAVPKLADIKAAIADVLPVPDPSSFSAVEADAGAPISRLRKPSAPPVPGPCTARERPLHGREMAPADYLPGPTTLERFDAAAIDLATPP